MNDLIEMLMNLDVMMVIQRISLVDVVVVLMMLKMLSSNVFENNEEEMKMVKLNLIDHLHEVILFVQLQLMYLNLIYV
jgi:hypothetical protein